MRVSRGTQSADAHRDVGRGSFQPRLVLFCPAPPKVTLKDLFFVGLNANRVADQDEAKEPARGCGLSVGSGAEDVCSGSSVYEHPGSQLL